MRLKLIIITILIISCGTVFPQFELDFLVKSGAVGSFTDKINDDVYNYMGELNLQLGYKFAENKNLFKGVSLLFDFGTSGSPISYSISKNNKHTVEGNLGIFTGLALKFIFSPSLTSKQDLVFGIASGAKFTPIIDYFDTKVNKVPISPYVKLFFEDRIYGNDKFAFVVGFGLYYEYMIFDKSDSLKLFGNNNVKAHHSIGEMVTLGFHFGKR